MKNQRLRNLRASGTGSAFTRRARYVCELEYSETTMKKVREITDSEEPIGIIISR